MSENTHNVPRPRRRNHHWIEWNLKRGTEHVCWLDEDTGQVVRHIVQNVCVETVLKRAKKLRAMRRKP